MEVSQERRWRHEAGWAVAVILAAILLIIVVVAHYKVAPAKPEPPPDDYSYWRQFRQLSDYLDIMIPLLAAGALSLLFYIVAFAKDIKVLPQADQPPVAWNLWDVVKAVAGTILVVLIVQLQSLTTRGRAGQGLDEFLNVIILHVAILVFPLYFVSFKGGSYRALGFTGHKWFSNAVNGLFVYLAVLPLFAMTVLLWSLLLHVVGADVNPPDYVPLFEKLEHAWLKWVLVAVIAVFGPIAEEVFFRGYMYPAMRRRMGPAGAILLNAAIFSLIHLNVASLLPIMLLGAGMAFLFEKTKSLVSCSVFHIAHNSLQMILLFRVVMSE